MYQSGRNQTKRGFVVVALLFAVMFFAAGCGKADQAYDQAMKLAEEGNYQEAAKSFEKAIEANGEKAEYYIGYGMTLNHLGEYKKAVKQFENAYQEMDNKISRKNNKQLYYGEALAYYGMYQYDKALERCQDALDIEGQPEIDSSVYATMAVVQWALGNSAEALKSLDNLLENDTKDVNGYLQRGQLYLHMDQPESALQDFSQALQLDKNCYDAYFGMYDAYAVTGQVDAARESLEMLTGIQAKSAEQKMQVGRAYQVLGEEDQAISYLEDAQKQKCVEAEYYLGLVQMAKQDYDTAIDYFERYLQNAGVVQIPEVYNQLAGALIASKEYDKAEEYLEEGLALGMSSAYQGLSKNQVILLEKQQKFSKAKKAANTYLKAYPADEAMIKELEFIKTRIRTKKKENQEDSKTQDGQPSATSDPAESGQPSPTPERTADSQSSSAPGSTEQETVSASPDRTTEDPASTDEAQGDSGQSPVDQAQGSRYSVQ